MECDIQTAKDVSGTQSKIWKRNWSQSWGRTQTRPGTRQITDSVKANATEHISKELEEMVPNSEVDITDKMSYIGTRWGTCCSMTRLTKMLC